MRAACGNSPRLQHAFETATPGKQDQSCPGSREGRIDQIPGQKIGRCVPQHKAHGIVLAALAFVDGHGVCQIKIRQVLIAQPGQTIVFKAHSNLSLITESEQTKYENAFI